MNFICDVVFPIIDIGKINFTTKRLAGPKALAAQTYQSKSVELPFLESQLWAKYAELFSQPVGTLEQIPLISLPTGRLWIAYPVAIDAAFASGTCVTWIERTETRRYFRHVRLYQNETDATAGNIAISSFFND